MVGTRGRHRRCRVTNTSDRPGKDVVQLYVRDVDATVRRPVRELKAFAKVELAPGATTRVSFPGLGIDQSVLRSAQLDRGSDQ